MLPARRHSTIKGACLLLAGCAVLGSLFPAAPAAAETTTTVSPELSALGPDVHMTGGKLTGDGLAHPVALTKDEAGAFLVDWVRLTLFGNPPLGPIPAGTPKVEVTVTYTATGTPTEQVHTSWLAYSGANAWGSGTGAPNTWTPVPTDLLGLFHGKLPKASGVPTTTPAPAPAHKSSSSSTGIIIAVIAVVVVAGAAALLVLRARKSKPGVKAA